MRFLASIVFFSVLQPAQADDGAAARDGETLYYDYGCYGCHGFNATMRVPLVGDASGIMSSEALFVDYLRLRADQNPVNPKNSMPNYSAETLSDVQARKIYAYIRGLEVDTPALEEIAVMQDMLDAAKMREKGKDN